MTNILKEIREKKGVSISELARKSGLSRQTIYNIEGDPERVLDSKTMESIANALGVKVSKIFLM